MKKIHISASLLMAMIFLGNAHGFVEKRHQWWEIRLQNLSEEKARLHKNTSLDRQVLGIIDNEMNRARDIIAVFESEMRDDGSLTHEERVMTDTGIAAEVRRTVPPLFALHQLEALVNETGSGASSSIVREAVEQRLQGMIQASFSEKSPELAKRIMDTHISRDEWKSLAIEYFIGRMMASRKSELDHAVADITGRMTLALKEKRNRTNAKELRTLAVRLTREYLAECGTHAAPHDSAALEASGTWKRIRSVLARDLGACKKIIALIHGPGRPSGTISPGRIMLYHKNPADLESLLFRGRHPQQANNVSGAKSDGKKAGNAMMMEIPAPLRTAGVLEDIDRLRRRTIAALTGREDRTFFDGTGKRMDAAINRHTAGMKKIFSREEEKARLLRKKEGENLQLSNEGEFLRAKKEFHAALSLIDEYATKSLECIIIVSEGKHVDSGSLVVQYRERVQRNHEYLTFASALVTECSRLASIEDPRVHKDFAASMARIHFLFNFIGTGLVLDRNDRTHLTKRDLGTIRDLKSEFIGAANSMKSDIRVSYGQYLMKRSSTAVAGKISRKNLKETIAQDEIDVLYRHTGECVELFEQYRYGEKSLFRYAEQFRAFMKEAGTAAPSQSLEYSLKMNSIAASLDQFDDARIAREFATKKYLHNEVKSSLARLATLLDFYKKKKVSFRDAPTNRDLAELEGRISSMPQVRIDSWVMNESNYREIDKKAVKKLSLLLNRMEYAAERNKGDDVKKRFDSSMTITIREPELSLTFPRGWEEETVGEAETYTGVVKSLHSDDGNFSVKLVKLTMERGDMKNSAEVWIRKSGCSLIEKRWEKAGDIQYLWILARDKNKNISETCSVSKDGYTVLITGKTGRDQHLKFKAQFKKIIGSLQMETL